MSPQWELELEHKVIQAPSWKQINNAITQLDGKTFSTMSLRQIGKGELLISGGTNQRYLVIYFPENNLSLTLTDLSLIGPDLELTIEGVASEYPAKYCVNQSLVFKICEYFFKTNKLPPDSRWEIENTGVKADLNKYL